MAIITFNALPTRLTTSTTAPVTTTTIAWAPTVSKPQNKSKRALTPHPKATNKPTRPRTPHPSVYRSSSSSSTNLSRSSSSSVNPSSTTPTTEPFPPPHASLPSPSDPPECVRDYLAYTFSARYAPSVAYELAARWPEWQGVDILVAKLPRDLSRGFSLRGIQGFTGLSNDGQTTTVSQGAVHAMEGKDIGEWLHNTIRADFFAAINRRERGLDTEREAAEEGFKAHLQGLTKRYSPQHRYNRRAKEVLGELLYEEQLRAQGVNVRGDVVRMRSRDGWEVRKWMGSDVGDGSRKNSLGHSFSDFDDETDEDSDEEASEDGEDEDRGRSRHRADSGIDALVKGLEMH